MDIRNWVLTTASPPLTSKEGVFQHAAYTFTMPKLSLIVTEAELLIGYLPEPKRRALQQVLADLCETRWRELRGPEPATVLAHALWSVTPPLADLFAEIYAAGDPRLDHVLQGHKPAWGLALLVLEEIVRGDAEGARLAHEPMMVFESAEAAMRYAERIAAALRGQLEALPLHRHTSQPPLWKALAVVAAHTGRCDLKAISEVIRLLAAAPAPAGQPSDEALERLRNALHDLGVRFLGIDKNQIRYEQHGHAHKPVSIKQLGDALIEIRQTQLAQGSVGQG